MRNRNGFTLIELLVVITIIAVLAGLLIPGVLRAMKQAKTNRALAEMQHLATIITQIYSEVGYYVRLEDLAKPWSIYGLDTGRAWTSNSNSYANGRSDDDLVAGGTNPDTALNLINTTASWSGPYTTFKNYSITSAIEVPPDTVGIRRGPRPIDPWGKPTGSDTEKAPRQYRMFWTTAPSVIPAGATTGAMVIISAGGDGKYDCNIGTSDSKKTPDIAVAASFATFNPSSNKGDDVYYIFNAGIQ